MLTSTIYDVRIRYGVDDRAAAGVRRTTEDVRQLGRETGRVTGMATRLGAALVGAFGMRAAGRALIGYNATVQDTKIQIGGMLALTKKTNLTDELGRADRLFANLQRRANTLPGTTQEFTKMAGMLTQPIIDAGLGMKNLEDLTVSAVVGAKALGVEWEVAARDIDQALRGQFRSVDVFTGKILGSVGFKGEEGRARFNAMDGGSRADTLRDAMMQKQLIQLAAAQGNTVNGALSTLQDTAQQFFGKIGLPLFKAMTAELKGWNTWLAGNQGRVDAFAARFADGLVSGFNVIKEGVGFIVEHADTLIAIGKVWAAIKIGGMLGMGAGGQLMSGAGGIGAIAGWMKKGTAASDKVDPFTGEYSYTPSTPGGRGRQAVGGLRGAASNLGLLGASLGAGYALGSLPIFDQARTEFAQALETIHPRMDAVSREFYDLEMSSKRLDVAMQDAARRGHGFTSMAPLTGLRGQRDVAAQNANLVRDLARAQDAVSGIPESLQTLIRHFGPRAGYDAVGLGARDRARQNADAAGLGSDVTSAGGVGMYSFLQGIAQGKADSRAVMLEQITNTVWNREFSKLTSKQQDSIDIQGAQLATLQFMARMAAISNLPAEIREVMASTGVAGLLAQYGAGKGNMSKKPNVNVTINRIEVQSDDPDRFAFGLLDAFRDVVQDPAGAGKRLRRI